ncbi:hypothetical protein [Streptomyces sp. NPDC018031]|uniref:hypothetical protein n=1 Tax=Streptomyces sp. NPDC018031 TaxID=3365033 RepID=UPI0037AB117F
MRRVRAFVVPVFAAATVALASPLTAVAATGTLVLSHQNPSGCFDGAVSRVQNNTDQLAFVYDSQGCVGELLGVLTPGESRDFDFATSVFVS